MFERLEALAARLEVLERMLMDPDVVSDPAKLRAASTEHAHLRSIVDAYRAHQAMQAELAEARQIASEEADQEMRAMAREEAGQLEEALDRSHEALKVMLLPKDPYEGRPVLLEIRAGTGGDEAALFAGDLFNMYRRFAEARNLKLNLVSANPITVGGSGKTLEGYKEIVASISGDQAYNLLRFESGVHRVQRVPATESQGRTHTSAATVAVLPEPDEVEIHIEAKDLRIDVMRAGGPGGQSVNTTDSAVRIVHLPTGLTVQCQDEKSQLKNKASAMRVLKARLLAQEQERSAKEGNDARRAMVGSGDRSERIRTYNFPQNRLTDHRINLTLYKLDAVMTGDLDDVYEALVAEHRAKLLEQEGVA